MRGGMKCLWGMLVLLGVLLAMPVAARGVRTNGEDYEAPDGSLATHAVVGEFPSEGASNFTVTVNGHKVGLYNDRSHWGGLVEFGSFEFVNGTEVTINITYAKPLTSYEVLPQRQLDLLSVRRKGRRTVEIRTARADQNITLVVNGEPRKDVLHLFANSVDSNAPQVADRSGYHRYEEQRLHYFGAGFHDLQSLLGGKDMLVLEDGWRVYLAAGAVVRGRIGMWGVHKGTAVRGRGMLYNDTANPHVLLEANGCEGADVEGVLLHAHRPGVWQVAINHCRNVEMKGVKILSTRYASTDGIDIINCQQCAFLNTFVRSCDDAIAIKGLGESKPADCTPSRNITLCGMQLWNDCNCALGIGAENRCSLYENIRFMNSSILFSYDDPDYHETLDERAAMAICCIHGTYFRDISYENIDVYHCERLIAAGFQPSFWFGSLPGDQSTPGGMERIRYCNIRSLTSSGSRIANEIYFYGWQQEGTPAKWVDGVSLEDVTIEGERVNSCADGHLRLGPNVRGISFGDR